jgi:hypothetical protein
MQNKLLLKIPMFVKPSTGFYAACLHASAAMTIYALYEANGKILFCHLPFIFSVVGVPAFTLFEGRINKDKSHHYAAR